MVPSADIYVDEDNLHCTYVTELHSENRRCGDCEG